MGNNVKGARTKLYGKPDKRTRRVSSQPSIPPQDQVNLTTHLCNIYMIKFGVVVIKCLNWPISKSQFSTIKFHLKKKKKRRRRRRKDLCEMIFGLALKNNMLICPSTSLFLFMHLVMYIFIRWTLPFVFLFIYLFFFKGGWLNNGVWSHDI